MVARTAEAEPESVTTAGTRAHPGAGDDSVPVPGPEPTEQGVLRWAFLRRRRWIVGAAVFTAVHQMCEAAVPVLIGAVVDHAVRHGGPDDLALWIGLLAVLFAVLTTAMRLGGRWNRQGSQGAAHDLRVVAVARILDPRGFANGARNSGSLLSTATSDSLRIGLGNRAWVIGSGAVAALAFGAVALLLTSVTLGLLVLIGLVPLLAATRLLAKPLSARGSAEQAQVARATGTAADLIRGLRIIKGLGVEPAAQRRYRTASRSALAATVRAARWSAGYDAVTLLLNGLFLALVALVGARLAVEGTISVGEFVASVGLAQFLIGPSSRFGGAMSLRARARGSAGRMAKLLAEPYAVTGGNLPGHPLPAGALELTGVRNGPLRKLDLRIESGTTLGIVAPDPAVAAALLDVLALRTLPEDGGVALGGVPLDGLELDAARRMLLVADHDSDLFDATVAENVAVAADAGGMAATGTERGAGAERTADAERAAAGAERVAAAMAAADADEVVRSLPQGAESRIGERGRSLSGGQRQRVALARALASGAPVLVLHEPTTAVDAATEAKIAAGLRGVRTDGITLLVTTSPILLQSCDRVVLLTDGAVGATGTHHELTSAQPSYHAAVMA
ncbi:ABC transporter transmembrane domain-containing protein [Streptomyces sp. NPDC059398]|uniref:ABC transporter transmembrane domain-containing protein n=1 Tax=Streptomyces sp. NPDC059398 TaxID=3346820 RepID=UPI00369A1D73